MRRQLNDYPQISLRLEDSDGRLDFHKIFGRLAAIEIEIGCGRGGFLLQQAASRPEVDFLGIEWASRYYRYCVDRFGRHGLFNIRMVRAEASAFLTDFVSSGSVSCFHIYFPDPWPKKRHHKRRFLNSANTAELVRCLKSGGVIRIATDHGEYFEQIHSVIGSCRGVLSEIDFSPADAAAGGEWVGTNFECKYRKASRPIYTLAARKLEG